MTTKIIFTLFSIFLFGATASSQTEAPLPTTKSEYEQNYKRRIEQAQIAGQYIPKDLPDAIEQLNKLTDQKSRDKFKMLNEYDAQHKMFFSLTRWVCTNWGFYEGSRMSHYLKEVGISFPEDQATAIIIAWHRTLNKKDINFRQIRDSIVEKRKLERDERLKNAKVIKEEVIKPANPAAVKN